MTDVLPFRAYCGPTALAAVAGLQAEQAAARLVPFFAEHGYAFDGTGTPMEVMLAALQELGYRAEAWSPRPGGWRIGPADPMTRARFHDLFADDPPAPTADIDPDVLERVRAELAPRWALGAARARRRAIAPLTVEAWLKRFPRGAWLLFVEDHVMAAKDGAIVSGWNDGAFDRETLRDVWRVCR